MTSPLTRHVHAPVVAALLAAVTLVLPAIAGAQPNVSDETAPVVTQISFATPAVDTTSGSQNVTVTVTATDDLSGVNYMYVYLQTLANSQPDNNRSTSCFVSSLASGTRTNGTFTGTCSFQQYSQSGTWYVYYVDTNDMVGNNRQYYNNGNQLSALAPQTISVTAPTRPIVPPNTSAIPEIHSLSVTPATVDISASPQTLTIEARITSADATFSFGYAYLRDQGFNQTGVSFSS